MQYDKPIVIQRQDPDTEEWSDLYALHASVNKTRQSEYSAAGATQSHRTLTFRLRFFAGLEPIATDTQGHRIIYRNVPYNIVDYDDFMESHQEIRLTGVSYG